MEFGGWLHDGDPILKSRESIPLGKEKSGFILVEVSDGPDFARAP